MVEANTSGTDGLDRAIDVLDENLTLLTGHRPGRQRLLPGQAHVHRVALSWYGPQGETEVCLQVLAQSMSATTQPGWLPAEARAVAEALDLKARVTRRRGRETEVARLHGIGPSYHLVLLSAASDPRGGELDGRCAALEAGYLDGAGWMRLYTDGKFGEGSFTRVVERARNDIRKRLGTPGEQQRPPSGNHGLC